MRFRRLKLTGFKSFVEPADLRIEPGLTGVVGPNGCGKSNLLEALRWVMGEGSPKSLRGGGMEDVIFAGTAQRPPRDFAEVSLLLEQPGTGESEVTRRIERGAGSAYRIDGRDVRQKDVALLFADAATGAHSPALVSQGRISAIISAKPAERRQMLEEAAGIAGLHVRRKDAEGKLRATEANLQRLDELLGEQESRIAALRRQARVAERYKALTESIRLSEGRLLYRRWSEAEAAARTAGAEADEASRVVEMLGRKLDEAQDAQAAAALLVAERRQAALRAREEGQELAHKLATNRAALDTVRRRLADNARAVSSLEVERSRELQLQDDATQAIAALAAEQTALAARLETYDRDHEQRIRNLSAAEQEAREAEAALASLLTREASMQAERRVAEAALSAARSHHARLEEEARRLAAQEEALGDGSACRTRRELAQADAELARRAIQAAEQAIAAAEQARRDARAEQERSESEAAEVRARHKAAASEAQALERGLSQVRERGVAALVTVKPGYEKALAAALGDDLNAPLGLSGWSGAEPLPGDPPLAAGLDALSCYVNAPPELTRRLAQVAVVEADEGQPLAVGQRLVTRDGHLRRWDGFAASDVGAATAERLQRRNRLEALHGLLPDLSEALAAAQAAQAATAQQLVQAGSALDHARSALTAAEMRARQAAREEDAAASALERHEEQLRSLRERRAELAPVREAAADAVAQAEAALRHLPQAGSLSGELTAARSAAAEKGRQLAERRADLATAARIAAADRERQIVAAREAAAWDERAGAARKRVADAGARAESLASEKLALSGEPERLAGLTEQLEQQLQGSSAMVSAALAAEREAEAALADLAAALARTNEAVAAARETRAAAAARAEAQVARRIECGRLCGEKFQCPPPLLPHKLGFDADDWEDPNNEVARLERLTAERERLGPVNLVAEQEMAELDRSRLQGAAERDELAQAVNRLRGSIGSLNREGRARLLEAFTAVDRHFQSLFATLFDGGQAHLALTDSDDPLEAGLEIMAQPPGKRLSSLSLLSGGEQALTAVALIFALFLTKPSPICVLDEVDAPLDDANVERFCDLLVRMTAETDTRYLIVTHNAVTMSRMHRLYGVTMVERGVSRLVSVDLGGAEQLLAAE
jgi:chromosome segregation protein